jgi:cytochrome c551/c552
MSQGWRPTLVADDVSPDGAVASWSQTMKTRGVGFVWVAHISRLSTAFKDVNRLYAKKSQKVVKYYQNITFGGLGNKSYTPLYTDSILQKETSAIDEKIIPI